MKFDTSLPPEDFFFLPGRDPGMAYVEEPGWILRRVPGARINQIAASDHPKVQTLMEGRLESRWPSPEQNVTFEFNTVPVVLQQARHRNSFASSNGKWITNAAAGDRLLTRYLAGNPSTAAARKVQQFFSAARSGSYAPVPVWNESIDNLEVVIECRNQFNFYHFLSEALGNLSHFARLSHRPVITFQCRKGQHRSFPRRFIEALYPEVAERVRFVDDQVAFARVLSPYNHRHYFYQVGDPRVDSQVAAVMQRDDSWGQIGADRARRKFVSKNSFDTSLRNLQERALSRVDSRDMEKLPRRIIVSRDPDSGARDREFEGARELAAALKPHGFVEVYFEKMSPLEQITTMQAADMMIAGHGAAFANMVFARPDAHVIEIGTAQTQVHRWGDFLPNAHVAGCTYTTIFADMAGHDGDEVPPMKTGHRGVRLGKKALDAVMELAEQAG